MRLYTDDRRINIMERDWAMLHFPYQGTMGMVVSPVHLPILAEYCGLASTQRAERPVGMLRAFIDDSTERGEVLVLAGYLATVKQWLAFSDRWQQALTMKPHWPVFKMSDIQLSDPAQMERAEYHYRIIEEFIPDGFCTAIPIPALKNVVSEFGIHPKYGNPYYLAWLVTISLFRNSHLKKNWKQTVDLFFDVQNESKMVLQAWDILSENHGGDMAPFENAPMFRRDDQFLPLQAADLLAWWARKFWMKEKQFKRKMWVFPWQERSPGPNYIFQEMNEDGIRTHFRDTMVKPDLSDGV